jgi:hypothetical protein
MPVAGGASSTTLPSTPPADIINMPDAPIPDLKGHAIPCLNLHLCQNCDAATQVFGIRIRKTGIAFPATARIFADFGAEGDG